jgi:hypothetical protein
MTLNQIRVLNDMLAAARRLREKANEKGVQPVFMNSLERFSYCMAADDDALEQWKITRAQHKQCIAEAYQKLKQEN